RRAPVEPGGHGPDDGPDQAGGGAGGGPPLRGARRAGAGGRPGRRLVRKLPGRRSVGLTAVSRTRVACAVTSILLAACSTTGGSDTVTLPAVGGARPIVLSSSAFADGGRIPARYTCDGRGVSPLLQWSEQ